MARQLPAAHVVHGETQEQKHDLVCVLVHRVIEIHRSIISPVPNSAHKQTATPSLPPQPPVIFNFPVCSLRAAPKSARREVRELRQYDVVQVLAVLAVSTKTP